MNIQVIFAVSSCSVKLEFWRVIPKKDTRLVSWLKSIRLIRRKTTACSNIRFPTRKSVNADHPRFLCAGEKPFSIRKLQVAYPKELRATKHIALLSKCNYNEVKRSSNHFRVVCMYKTLEKGNVLMSNKLPPDFFFPPRFGTPVTYTTQTA